VGYSLPHWPKENRKKRKNLLSAHLHGLLAVTLVSNGVYSNFKAFSGGGGGLKLSML